MITVARKTGTKEKLEAFFMGDIYPAVISFLVAVGSIFEIELYLAAVHISLAAVALLISKSIKPVIISIMTFVMHISVGHAPYYPSYSDYFYTGWRFYLVIAMAVVVVAAFSAFTVKNRIYRKISYESTPFILPLIPLFFAFLSNGAFSGKWVPGDLLFGLLNSFIFCILPIILYHGFSDSEDSASIAKYFSYISMLTALVIIAELTALFLTNGEIFEGGSINKVEVALGWGIWNLVGITLSLLVPQIFYGVHKNRYPWLYFSVATLAYIFAVLTMSRSALLFGGIGYISCIIISCFKGKRRHIFRKIALSGFFLSAFLIFLFKSEVYILLKDYFERGFSDNGRFALWRAAFENFSDAPIFGGGFYGLRVDDSLLYPFGPLAKQAHNTVLQLLSATGLVGISAYAYYRISVLRAIFLRPTAEVIFMGTSMGVLLLGSLVDNFIFNIYPMHFYTMALVIVLKAQTEPPKTDENTKKTCKKRKA